MAHTLMTFDGYFLFKLRCKKKFVELRKASGKTTRTGKLFYEKIFYVLAGFMEKFYIRCSKLIINQEQGRKYEDDFFCYFSSCMKDIIN